MDQMKQALMKAGLVTKEPRQKEAKEWRENAYKNRFGHPALFEVWRISKFPHNYKTRCALCGKQLFEHIEWKPCELSLNICPACYIHGRKFDPDKFPALEAENAFQSANQ